MKKVNEDQALEENKLNLNFEFGQMMNFKIVIIAIMMEFFNLMGSLNMIINICMFIYYHFLKNNLLKVNGIEIFGFN